MSKLLYVTSPLTVWDQIYKMKHDIIGHETAHTLSKAWVCIIVKTLLIDYLRIVHHYKYPYLKYYIVLINQRHQHQLLQQNIELPIYSVKNTCGPSIYHKKFSQMAMPNIVNLNLSIELNHCYVTYPVQRKIFKISTIK